MYLNVAQLLKESSGSTRTYEVDETFTLIDQSPVSRVTGRVSLLRTDKGVWVSTALNSEVVCACGRCLEGFVQPVRMTIEEEFLPLVDMATGVRLKRDGEADSYIDQRHILDIRETVRQYCSLSLPMKLLCREDCAGFCLNCGVNLNEAPCLCDRTPFDVRWGPLLEIVSATDNDD